MQYLKEEPSKYTVSVRISGSNHDSDISGAHSIQGSLLTHACALGGAVANLTHVL